VLSFENFTVSYVLFCHSTREELQVEPPRFLVVLVLSKGVFFTKGYGRSAKIMTKVDMEKIRRLGKF